MQNNHHAAPMNMPRASLSPNQYSATYLLGLQFTVEQRAFVLYERISARTKVYQYAGRFYVVPQQGEAPPEGYNWVRVATRRSRDIYIGERKKA